jgi:hypothetical protein
MLDLFNTGTSGFFFCGIQPNGNTSVCVWSWQFGGSCHRRCGGEQPIHRHCVPASDVDISVCDDRRGEFYRPSRPVPCARLCTIVEFIRHVGSVKGVQHRRASAECCVIDRPGATSTSERIEDRPSLQVECGKSTGGVQNNQRDNVYRLRCVRLRESIQ